MAQAPASSEPFTILAVGTVGVRKGTHYLLEAASRMDGPRPSVVLIGGASNQSYARRFCVASSGRLHLEGPRRASTNWCTAFGTASAFVLSSIEDGWGHVTVEAMAAGSTRRGALDHAGSSDAVLTDGENGFVMFRPQERRCHRDNA